MKGYGCILSQARMVGDTGHNKLRSNADVDAHAQEAEAEEDGEAQRIAEWDRAAADAAYRAEVERAQREQQLLEERAALVRLYWCNILT